MKSAYILIQAHAHLIDSRPVLVYNMTTSLSVAFRRYAKKLCHVDRAVMANKNIVLVKVFFHRETACVGLHLSP
jgi:hypothetical protein